MTHPLTPREKVEPSLNDLLRQAVETMKSWTPEQREAHFEAQKKAWVAAEMAFGDEGTRVITALASGSGDHAELARLAEAASGSEWQTYISGRPEYRNVTHYIEQNPPRDLPFIAEVQKERDAAFIAAANPAAVLALLAENAALREDRDGMVEEVSRSRARLHAATEAERKLAEAVGLLRDFLPWSRKFPDLKGRITAFLSKEAERG